MEKISRKVEDYLETIYLLQKEKGYLKIRDIADAMGVRPPSVVEMLQRLEAAGFVVYEKYNTIKMTKKGMSIGEKTAKKHEIFRKLLAFIGLDEKIASEDACEMEHHLHRATIMHFNYFVEYLETSKQGEKCRKEFMEYLKVKELKKKIRD